MIEFEIDGVKVKAEPGETIIQAADRAGVYIPRFCYHKKLSIAANCRMCLVEIEKAPKPTPACAFPASQDMKVFTRSPVALKAQRAVMEFLLINHPLDCPVCDQGGECELQDLSMGYGEGVSQYTERKKCVDDEDIGPLISTYMTRCIKCTRCVRFGDEIAGMPEIGAVNRGEDTEISTYVGKSVKSEVSGNIIDICPVGALTSKPYKFTARAWELKQHASIAPHDCLGSNIYIHTASNQYQKGREVKRVVPLDNEKINETWLSDRDRFSYEGLNSENRVTRPMIKQGGKWIETDWQSAMDMAYQGFAKIVEMKNPDAIGGLISPSATTEEHYLFQQLLRAIGTNNIDHRIRQIDFSDSMDSPTFPGLSINIEELEKQDTIVLIGSNIRHEQPLAGVRVRKAWKNGGKVLAINPVKRNYNFDTAKEMTVGISNMVPFLSEVVKALADKYKNKRFIEWLKDIKPSQDAIDFAEEIDKGVETAILLGADSLSHPQAGAIKSLVIAILAILQKGNYGELTTGANSAGAWLAGAVPHRLPTGENDSAGLNAQQMFSQPLDGYLLHGVEPEFDVANPQQALTALRYAPHVVVLSPFVSETMKDYANVILPIGAFSEISGSYVNVEGTTQRFRSANAPMGEARPGWKVLRVMGNFFEFEGFDYKDLEEVQMSFKEESDDDRKFERPMLYMKQDFVAHKPKGLIRIVDWPMYRVDATTRYAKSLQKTISDEERSARIHSKTVKQLKLNIPSGHMVEVIQNDESIQVKLVIDDNVPEKHVYLPAGLEETAGFGEVAGIVEVKIP